TADAPAGGGNGQTATAEAEPPPAAEAEPEPQPEPEPEPEPEVAAEPEPKPKPEPEEGAQPAPRPVAVDDAGPAEGSVKVLSPVEDTCATVDGARRAVRAEFKEREGFSLTYLPFISRAVIDALGEFPKLNASVGDDQLIVHRKIHLGIAVDLNFEGLLVPVIHDAQDKRLRAIAREVSDLAGRARTKKLGVDDLANGTFTITNPGPFGTFIT